MSAELTVTADVLGVASFILLIGGYVLYYYENKYKAYKDFRNRLFKDHINFSLNSVDPGDGNHLRLRTLVETKADHVFASKVLINKINDACEHTSPEESFIVMKNQADQEFMLRATLNYLSSRFSRGFLAQAMGDPVNEREFVIGMTYERNLEVRNPPVVSKIRVMVMLKDDLMTYFAPSAEPTPDKFKLDSKWHKNRVATLAQMADHIITEEEKWKAGESYIPRVYALKLALQP